MPDDIRVVHDESAYRALMTSDDLRDFLMEEAAPVVERAKSPGYAPRRTGAGAESIRAEPVVDIDEWTVRVSWTRDRFYMYFHNEGTDRLRATNFLERALEGVAE